MRITKQNKIQQKNEKKNGILLLEIKHDSLTFTFEYNTLEYIRIVKEFILP